MKIWKKSKQDTTGYLSQKIIINNTEEVVTLLLEKIGFRFSGESMEFLKSHPDFPSLNAIKGLLDFLSIPHVAARISFNELKSDPPFPLLVHVNTNGGLYLLVESINDDQVVIAVDKNKSYTMSLREFLAAWSGIVLAIDDLKERNEPNYINNLSKQLWTKNRIPLLMGSLIILGVGGIVSHGSLSWHWMLLFFCQVFGLLFSSLSVQFTLGNREKYLNNFCGILRKGSSCTRMFELLKTKIFGILSWGEFSFCYYLAIVFSMLLSMSPQTIGSVTLFSFAAAPVIPYLLYQQISVKNYFCPYCLLALLIVILNVIIAAFTITQSDVFIFDIGSLCLLLSIFTATIVLYSFISDWFRTTLVQAKEIFALKRISRNKVIFNVLSSEQRFFDLSEIDTVRLGNHKASQIISIVVNPTCAPCHKILRQVVELLSLKPDLLVEQIFLTSSAGDSTDTLMAKIYLVMNEYKRHDVLRELISEVHGADIKSLMLLLEKSGLPKETDQANAMLEKHNSWCQSNFIVQTPFVIVNGRALPDVYSIQDMQYFL